MEIKYKSPSCSNSLTLYRKRLHSPLITAGAKASDTKRLCPFTVQGPLVSSAPNACALDICIWHRMRTSSSLNTLNAEIHCQLLFNLRTTGISVCCSTPLQSVLCRSHWAYSFKRVGTTENSCIPFAIPRICRTVLPWNVLESQGSVASAKSCTRDTYLQFYLSQEPRCTNKGISVREFIQPYRRTK